MAHLTHWEDLKWGYGTTGSSKVNGVIRPENYFSNSWPLQIMHGHSKTNVTCSTRHKEHAGRWNFVLATSEAKLSAITGFRHFSALDLSSEVTGWPRTLSLYINLFVAQRATCSFFFPRSSSSIRSETASGVVPIGPLVPWKDAKWPVPARIKTERVTSIPVNPYFCPKMAGHGVTLTSITADLSYVRNFNFVNTCRIDVGRGSESFVAQFLSVFELC